MPKPPEFLRTPMQRSLTKSQIMLLFLGRKFTVVNASVRAGIDELRPRTLENVTEEQRFLCYYIP